MNAMKCHLQSYVIFLIYICSAFLKLFFSIYTCKLSYDSSGADPEIFQRGGVEEENFEREMFVDTRINACTHKN